MEEVKWWASPHGSDWEDVRGPVSRRGDVGDVCKGNHVGNVGEKISEERCNVVTLYFFRLCNLWVVLCLNAIVWYLRL